MPRPKAGRILVVGASGVLGSRIVRRLLDGGESVRAMSRDPARLTDLAEAGAETVRGDLMHVPSLEAACAGITRVVSTANSFSGAGRQGPLVVDVQGHNNLMDVAAEAGVAHFCYVSATVPESFYAIDYFDAKRQVEDELRKRRFLKTILRPTAFMDTWAKVIGAPLIETGKTVVFGNGKHKLNLIAVDDVATIAARAVCREEPGDLLLPFGGPENLSLNEIVRVFRKVTGVMGKVRYLATWQMALTGTLVRPFNPVFARQVRVGRLLARDGAPFDNLETPEPYRQANTTLADWVRARYVPDKTKT